MSLENTRVTGLERHAQTVLVLVLVALLIWVGKTTQDTQVAVAAMAVEVQHLKTQAQTPNAKFSEIERRLGAIERKLESLHP